MDKVVTAEGPPGGPPPPGEFAYAPGRHPATGGPPALDPEGFGGVRDPPGGGGPVSPTAGLGLNMLLHSSDLGLPGDRFCVFGNDFLGSSGGVWEAASVAQFIPSAEQ